MSRRAGDLTPSILRLVAAVAVVVAAVVGRAADIPEARGGLVPSPRKTRDELVREWDLNADGTIDQGEVEIASSRMRRERAEMRLNSGIDPITGLPRGMDSIRTDPDDADATGAPTVPEDGPATEPDRDERPPLPGTRVPRPTVPRASPAPQADGGRRPPADGTRAAADLKRQPLTGGVKAGGLPARAGYGSGVPATSLNAGLPIPPRPRSAAVPPAAARGGLVPAPRTIPPAPRTTRSRDLYDPY